MSIASDIIRGHTDALILSVLVKRDSYGYDINKTILLVSGGVYELKEATLYTAFKRLEELGLITSYWGDENTGARRKYYSVTEKGKENYKQMLADWQEARDIFDKLLMGENYQ